MPKSLKNKYRLHSYEGGTGSKDIFILFYIFIRNLQSALFVLPVNELYKEITPEASWRIQGMGVQLK
jgi:hypothetical protein